MTLSIVIPTRNRNASLARCLDALAPDVQNAGRRYQVVVTDDSSAEGAGEMIGARYPWARWVRGPRRGPAANRNNGARQATGDWVVFLDDDCIPDAMLLQEYLRAIGENPGITVFEGKIVADRPARHYLEESPVNLTGGYMWSCNIMLRRDYFNDVLGGFDEGFPYAAMEDVDLRERIRARGERFVFVPDAFVVHPMERRDDYLELTRKRSVSWLYLVEKHPHLAPAQGVDLRGELRFYVKKVLWPLWRFGGRGLVTFLKAHALDRRMRKERRPSG